MKEELLEEIKEFLKKMTANNIPAMFLAVSGEKFVNVTNCKVDVQSQILVNHIDSSPEMQEAFTNELELVTKRELEQMQENG